MKKIFVIVAVISLMFGSLAFAAGQAQQNTGCGLGAAAVGAQGDDSLLLQLVITFLNGISGNQTFGITSGTSECKAPTKIVENERTKEFVAANMDNLAKDIAVGHGESLDTFAELMKISDERRSEVYVKLQANFSSIFTSEEVESADVIDNIVAIING